MARPKNEELREFVLRNVGDHPADIASFAAKSRGVTRASVNGYLRELILEGLLEATGKTKSRRYTTKELDQLIYRIDLKSPHERGVLPQEDVVWRDKFSSHFAGLPDNIVRICEYAFSEMVNNAIEHSAGSACVIFLSRYYDRIIITIKDDGIGIFKKITEACHLADEHDAILELSKGKLTTDRSRHSGEGIFFTSRMVDDFTLASGALAYIRRNKQTTEALLDVEKRPNRTGTAVNLEIATNADQTTAGTFEKYLDDELRFSKTVVPLRLASYEGDHLVSRSQARRIMSRVERFSTVILDFDGVAEIGQQFADEIFRVWAAAHPHVLLHPWNESSEVKRMIGHAKANASEDASQLSLSLEPKDDP
jgi:anti-sigma regulatory factor (Ser/Thr protein kinase)